MQELIQAREATLVILEQHIYKLSKLFREGYLKLGRGALIVYADIHLTGRLPTIRDYNTKEQSLDIFDSINIKTELAEMIEGYSPNLEGIMVIITPSTTFLISSNFQLASTKPLSACQY